MDNITQWLAPIASALVICAGQAAISMGQRRLDAKMDERHRETEDKRAADAEWRAKVDGILTEQERMLKSVADDKLEWQEWRRQLLERLDAQDKRTGTILGAQCSQMRSDIIHKCHRYLDDLGKASTEEKEALKAEHGEYTALCKANGIVNSFVDLMVQRVMELPEREV